MIGADISPTGGGFVVSERRGGFWNRAARRSGGNRPAELAVVTSFPCGHCGAECWPGRLERYLLLGKHEVGCCPSCGYVVRVVCECADCAEIGRGGFGMQEQPQQQNSGGGAGNPR
jgi:hypothetical protein